jgi:hypothetical protein
MIILIDLNKRNFKLLKKHKIKDLNKIISLGIKESREKDK